MTNLISARLLNQQLAAPLFSEVADIVSHMGAMQAQEYRLMRWAVGIRSKKPSLRQFQTAFDSGQIVRLHIMRGTWQLVSAADYWWMLDLCAEKSKSVLKGWMSANRISIPEREIEDIRETLVATTERLGSVTKEDYVAALAGRGVVMDDHRLSYHIRIAEMDGVLCSGRLSPAKATYSLSLAKVGPHVGIDRDEALARLAVKYFQSHSPATMEDFIWWSGLGAGDCKRAVLIAGNELSRFRECGREFLVHGSCRTRGFRKGSVLLLPSYDEYLIGYKSRDVVLSPKDSPHAHNNSGIFYPVVAEDGLIHGNWSPFKKGLDAVFFDGPAYPEAECDALGRAREAYRKFLAK